MYDEVFFILSSVSSYCLTKMTWLSVENNRTNTWKLTITKNHLYLLWENVIVLRVGNSDHASNRPYIRSCDKKKELRGNWHTSQISTKKKSLIHSCSFIDSDDVKVSVHVVSHTQNISKNKNKRYRPMTVWLIFYILCITALFLTYRHCDICTNIQLLGLLKKIPYTSVYGSQVSAKIAEHIFLVHVN